MEGVPDCEESEEADAEVACWGRWSAAGAEGEEGLVVFVNAVEEEDGWYEEDW